MNRSKCDTSTLLATALAVACVGVAFAQTPPAGAPSAAPAASPSTNAPAPPPSTSAPAVAGSALDQLSWLRGCWAGKVAQFDFVESWLAERGGMMVGINQTIVPNPKPASGFKTQDYQYLRLEQRSDGVYYVAIPSGKKEIAFKFTSVGEELGRKAYTFTNPTDDFPKKIVYMRGKEGWLFAKVAGEVAKHPKEVTYPMQHVDCLTGALLSE
jgi:Domain of unknown function (DUF6265)